jgi:hypothetical protein
MYMPVTMPGMSVTKATERLQTSDRIIKKLSRGGERVRQGRQCCHGDRSGAG